MMANLALDDDEMLRLALEASAREHQSLHADLVIDTIIIEERAAIQRPDLPHCPGGDGPVGGKLVQFNTFDQFHADTFVAVIQQYKAPSAICGYASLAGLMFLAEELPISGLRTQQEAEAMAKRLQNPQLLMPHIVAAMQFVHASRSRYIASHKASFTSRFAEDQYMQAWVANYEISDVLKASGLTTGVLLFMRFNQWPERDKAKHEEAERLEEERRFGGAVGNKSQVVHDFAAGDAMVLVEGFFGGPGPVGLHTMSEWLSAASDTSEAQLQRLAMVLDLNGHFAVASPVANWDGRPALALFNTTGASYLSGAGGLMAAAAFDLAFSPPPFCRGGSHEG